jgi:hypothetical protein
MLLLELVRGQLIADPMSGISKMKQMQQLDHSLAKATFLSIYGPSLHGRVLYLSLFKILFLFSKMFVIDFRVKYIFWFPLESNIHLSFQKCYK